VTLFPSVLCSPPPAYRNRRTPPIDFREVLFPKCAFRQSPHKNNIDIAYENKNQTSSSFLYLSFCQVLDSFSGISLLLRPFSLPFSVWIQYLKPSSPVKCSPVSMRLQIIYHNIFVGLTNTNNGSLAWATLLYSIVKTNCSLLFWREKEAEVVELTLHSFVGDI
jgi:hypothetical protein